MIDITQGDPLITITPEGAEITYVGGQPRMHRGFINLVLISLFTKPDDAINIFKSKESEKHKVDFEKYKNEPITVDSLNEQRNDAITALQGLKDEKQVSDIIVDVTNPSGYIRKTSIKIKPPGADLMEIILTNYGGNWLAQINESAA